MFKTTIWSELLDAAQGEPRAVDRFVARYRPPLVRYLCRRRVPREDAEDLAQEVLIRLFSQELLQRADQERGRFRSYLLGITHKVLGEQRRKRQALKRGGGVSHVPFELAAHDVAGEAGEAEFESCWLEHLLSLALEALASSHPRHHQLLQDTAAGRTPAEIAESTGRNPGQVRTDLHRARKRLAKQVRSEIARYCSSQGELDEELALFMARLSGA